MKKKIVTSMLVLFVAILLAGLCLTTGFLQHAKIDNRDLNNWEYDTEGIILGAKEFTLNGSSNVCWYLIHGYTSTPDEMRGLAEEIHLEFNETVVVPRWIGNAEVPSRVLNLTLYDWYTQVSNEFDILSKKCNNINVVGSSVGGAIATRLAENKEVNNLYLLNPYIFATYKPYRILRLETYIDTFANVILYGKKIQIGQINSQEGLDNHIAYWNMPLTPLKNSRMFFEEVKTDLDTINSPLLVQQSKNDKTSDIKSSKYIYANVESTNKQLVVFERSNHIILRDYDNKEAINNILIFEKKTRE